MWKRFAAGAVVLGLLALLAGTVALVRWRDSSAGPAQAGFEPAEAVDIVSVTTRPWQARAKLVGTVFPIQFINVRNELAGRVTEVNFQSGSLVNEGDVILRLDTSTEEADLASAKASEKVAEASIRVMQAELKFQELNLARVREAAARDAAAGTDVDRAVATMDSARANLDRTQAELAQSKARVALMEAEIAKKTIIAPFRARAGIRNVHPGQYLAEGADVVSLQGVSDEIFLDFAVPQSEAVRATPGMTVRANSMILGQEPVEIRVVAVDAAADRTTRNVRVRAVVPNPDERLKPGMFVDVEVPVGDESEHIVVPVTAVRRASYGDHVFLVEEDTGGPGAGAPGPGAPEGGPGGGPGGGPQLRARQQFVKLGPVLGSQVIVLEGLSVGQRIATNGSFKLRDGVLIIPAPPAAEQPAPASPGNPGGPASPDQAGAESKPQQASQEQARRGS
ncbi:MAG: efflux RND transporter periplasmic adaptor subunit [Planctomycetota bacterium]|nr:efflux RND transporter periplasmic adaptor subunit [Planctomycetota bacterium]